MAVTGDGEYTAMVVNRSLSTLSLIGGLFIIVCYYKFRDLRTFAFWLVFMVGISDTCQAISNMLGEPSNHHACQFQAWAGSFFGLASLMWQTAIAFTLFKAFLHEDPAYDQHNIVYKKTRYLIVCWGIPLLSSAVFAGTYGDAFGICWISEEGHGVVWRVLQFYLPLLVAVIFNAYVYYNVRKKMTTMGAPDSLTVRLKYYPLVLLVAWGPDVLEAVIEVVGGQTPHHNFAVVAMAFSACEGLFNAIVYGMTDEIRQRLGMWCGKGGGETRALMQDDTQSDLPDAGPFYETESQPTYNSSHTTNLHTSV